MATATITAVTIDITTDLSATPDTGPSVDQVSVGQCANGGIYHRINPYFVRPRGGDPDTVAVEFSCAHKPANSVEYGPDAAGVEPQSATWVGRVEVDSSRTRRTAAPSDHRPLALASVPSGAVVRTIACTFEAVEYFNSEKQRWDTFIPAPTLSDNCNVAFDLTL